MFHTFWIGKKGWASILEVLFYFSHPPADKHVHLRSFAARRNFAASTRQGVPYVKTQYNIKFISPAT